jgi:DNA gyrase/topoisomerase IV subunit B
MSTYKKLTQREHILLRSGMYIGSMDRVKEARWIYNSEKGEMEWKEVSISPGFLKIFDEILVNALDHRIRQVGLAASVPDAVPVKHIDVTITPERITVKNDGDGMEFLQTRKKCHLAISLCLHIRNEPFDTIAVDPATGATFQCLRFVARQTGQISAISLFDFVI